MAANNALLLTDIDYDGIKDNLKNFLSNQSELGDYDFDSSTLQILLNLLAYNTYMNSFYLNMVANEMFLDSAQIRSNVVSRAKMLGYTPRSAQGSTAVLNAVITPDDSPDSITIAANTNFSATIDGEQYIFVNPEAVVVNSNAEGVFSTNLSITEGRPQTFRYTVSSVNPVNYVIPNDEVDTRSISVRVQESVSNTSITTFTKATNLTAVTGNSAVFFLHENSDEQFEITFGDDVLGRAVNDGNIVIIGYRICNGSATNGANTFTAGSTIGGYSDYNLTLVSRAAGGVEKETIQSIKFNAPKNFETQNRAVTVKDYETIVKSEFSYVQAASAWGGEDNSPPTYGKVFISIKPVNENTLTSEQKVSITEFLDARNVVSIEPEIVDPTYLYVTPTVDVKFDPNKTTQSSSQLGSSVANRIVNYENSKLGIFGLDFVGSDFIKEIDRASDSFTSITTKLKISKKFTPNTTTNTDYTINFNRSLLYITSGVVLRGIAPTSHPGRGMTVDSTYFTYKGFGKTKFDDDGFGNVRTYYIDGSGVRVYTNRAAGVINYSNGLIKLNNLLITAYEGDAIEFIVDPDDTNIDTIRNQILLIKSARVNMYDTDLKKITARLTNINTQGNTTSITEDAIVSTVY